MEHFIQIPTRSGNMAAVLHYSKTFGTNETRPCERWPVIVVCHGFLGSRVGVDRLFVKAARRWSEAGFMVVRFDYAGCGESEGRYGEGGLEAMVDQTRRVIDYVHAIDCVDQGRVALLGHSLGGAVALLTAAADSRVKTLILWSAVAHPLNDIVRIVGKDAYETARQTGSVDFQGYTLPADFFDSLAQTNPLRHIRKFGGDTLVVHGTSDEVIPFDYCALYQRVFWLRSGGQCDKEEIAGAGHTFSTADHQGEVIARTENWLKDVEKRKQEWNDWII